MDLGFDPQRVGNRISGTHTPLGVEGYDSVMVSAEAEQVPTANILPCEYVFAKSCRHRTMHKCKLTTVLFE